MYYPQELIEEIRLQNDIVDIVSEYVVLKKKGSSYFGLCPFHNEKTPSFSVSPDKQIYYCFGCGMGGNVINFIMQMENYNFVEAVKYLAERAHINLPEPEYSEEAMKQAKLKKALLDIHKTAARYFYYTLHTERGRACLNYINKRQISIKFQKSFGLGFSSYDRNDLYNYLRNKGYNDDILLKSGLVIPEKTKKGFFDRFGNRLMFPIFDIHNNVIAFGGRIIGEGQPKYLNSPETPIFNKSRNLYALNLARSSRKKQLIVVEGYIDALTLHQAGFNNTVASLGTAFNSQHSKIIRKYAEEIILIYDSDDAGTNAALRALPILSLSGLKVKVLQVKDAKDPDEFIRKYGKEAFEKLLETAQSATTFQIECIRKKYNLNNTEDKIEFTKEISKLLTKLDNAIEQDAYIKEVSTAAKISEDSIRKEIFKLSADNQTPNYSYKVINKSISRYNTEDSPTDKGIIEAQEELLNIISNNDLIYHSVNKYLKADKFIGSTFKNIAAKIYEFKERKMSIYPAELLNYFENTEEQKEVTKIFTIQVEPTPKVVNDYVKLILETRIEMASKNSNDIEQMQQLLEDKRNLDKLNITLTDG